MDLFWELDAALDDLVVQALGAVLDAQAFPLGEVNVVPPPQQHPAIAPAYQQAIGDSQLSASTMSQEKVPYRRLPKEPTECSEDTSQMGFR
ncbi:hypothetical protein MTO96_015724 [Rhipicephalus appendiculatus]